MPDVKDCCIYSRKQRTLVMTFASPYLIGGQSLFPFCEIHIFYVDLDTAFPVTSLHFGTQDVFLLNTRLYELPCFTICIFNNFVFNYLFEYAHEVLVVDRITIIFFDIYMSSILSLQTFAYHLCVVIIFFRISTTDIT